jgi:hypothetical protein
VLPGDRYQCDDGQGRYHSISHASSILSRAVGLETWFMEFNDGSATGVTGFAMLETRFVCSGSAERSTAGALFGLEEFDLEAISLLAVYLEMGRG